jgi:hypothetical protein
MIKKTFVSSLRPPHLVIWCLIILCHWLIIVFLSPTSLWKNAKFLNAVMTIVPINRLPPPDPEPLANHAANKNQLKRQETKNAIVKSAKTINTNDSEPISVEKESPNELTDNASSSSVSSKDLTTLGSIANRYKLHIPKTLDEEILTPAQQAAQDVRSNSAKLTKSEKFAVAMGTLDCLFQARLPDGKVVREPGKWVVLPARSDGTLKPLAKARFCVRFHQAEDENGNDLTAISAGIKGKL